jgi:sec-independent protein translocase protein TatB
VFDVGISKLLIILAVALIVLGPEKLPAVAGQIGRWLGRARTMARQFRDQLEEEASSLQNVKRSFNAALDPNSTAVPAATAAAANLKQPVAGASLDAASQTAEGHAAGIPPGSGALPEADLPQPVFRAPPTEPTPSLTTATAPPVAVAPAAAPPAAAATAPAVAPPAALRAPAFAATPDYASAAVTLDVSADERGS